MENVIKEITAADIGSDPKSWHSNCSAVAGWLLRRLGPLKVIEIGTSYGNQLPTILPYCSSFVAVDPMYEWVPNVQPVEGWEPHRVNQDKIDKWWKNAEPWKDKVNLVIDSSYRAHADPKNQQLFTGAQILIVDGCHHPVDSVMMDYENFKRFMTSPHYVIWDDMDLQDVRKAADAFGGDWTEVHNTRICFM